MRIIRAVIAVALLSIVFTQNAGATLFFDFVGVCETNCDRFGLVDGDTFNETNVLGFVDGTDTSAGATFSLADIESFWFFGRDFLNVNDFMGPGGGPTGQFLDDDILGGFILANRTATTNICYHRDGTACPGDRFVSHMEFGGNFGRGPSGAAHFVRSSVPEPGTLALLSLGLLGLVAQRRQSA